MYVCIICKFKIVIYNSKHIAELEPSNTVEIFENMLTLKLYNIRHSKNVKPLEDFINLNKVINKTIKIYKLMIYKMFLFFRKV